MDQIGKFIHELFHSHKPNIQQLLFKLGPQKVDEVRQRLMFVFQEEREKQGGHIHLDAVQLHSDQPFHPNNQGNQGSQGNQWHNHHPEPSTHLEQSQILDPPHQKQLSKYFYEQQNSFTESQMALLNEWKEVLIMKQELTEEMTQEEVNRLEKDIVEYLRKKCI